MTEVVFKPTSQYNSKLDELKKIDLAQGTEFNVIQFSVPDHTEQTIIAGAPFIITQIIIWSDGDTAGIIQGYQFYINNQLILNSMAIVYAAPIYIPIPNWKMLKGYALKVVASHDPAHANNVYLTIIGYYA